MSLSIFGVIVLVAGLILLFRPLHEMFAFLMLSSLFGSSSAILLTGLGGSSISPGSLALVFFVARTAFSPLVAAGRLGSAIYLNRYLVAYCLYAAATAFILPRVFDGQLNVYPLKPLLNGGKAPLHFTSQNFTTAFYILGTMMFGPLGTMLSRWGKRPEQIIALALVIVWIDIGFVILDVVLQQAGRPDIMAFFRNAPYAQLTQDILGYRRLSGLFSEASALTGFTFPWLVFLTELWLRDIRPRATGITALGALLVLMLSTSTTAYFSIAVYLVILLLRFIFLRPQLRPVQLFAVITTALVTTAGFLSIAIVNGSLLTDLQRVFELTTVHKLQSTSGVERTSMASAAVDNFFATYGFGVGPGSFRSSSLPAAILGSVGIIGSLLFIGSILTSIRPFSRTIYSLQQKMPDSIGHAAAWGALGILLPAIVAAPSCDPGGAYALFCGYALGLATYAPRRRPDFAPDPRSRLSREYR